MKIILKFILFILIFSPSFLASKTLKIAISTDMTPYSFINEQKKLSGFFIDYWNLWSEKTGIKIEFVPSTWNVSLKNIKNSKVDIHAGIFINDERKEYIKYLDKIYKTNSNIFVLKKENISKIIEMNSKTLGFVKGTYYENYFKTNYPKIKIKTYNNNFELKIAFDKHEIDSFINDNIISWMNIIRYFDYNKVKKIDDFVLNNWFYAGVNKNIDIDTEKMILAGMAKINLSDLKIIENKWIINKEFRTFSLINKKDILNFEEREYLKNNKNLKLALIKGWKLMSFYDSNNEISGLHIDLLKKINEKINANIGYIVYENWSKAYNSSLKSQVNGIFGLSWSKNREKYFSYSSAYFFSPMYLVARKDDTSIQDLNNLKNKTSIIAKNSIFEKIIKRNPQNIKITYAKTQIEALEKIKNKEADFTLKVDAYEYDIAKYNLEIKKTIFNKDGELFIGTSKENKIFTSIINKALNSINKNEMDLLKDKWKNKKVIKSIFTKEELEYIENSVSINVGIEEWRPIIYIDNSDNLRGLAGDMLKLIFKYSGLKLNYIKKDWNTLLESFKNEEIDILPSTYYSKDRELFGLYSDSYLDIKNYLYVKKENYKILKFDDLKGEKLALTKGDANIEIIKKLYSNIKIIETKNIEESILKLVNNEVSAMYAPQIVVQYKLTELLISGLKVISENQLKINKLHIFSNKKNLLLKSILQKSLYLISIDEKNKIISKWLNKKDFKKELNILFAKEREPYIFENSYLKGFEYDLIKEIFRDYKPKINISNAYYENQYELFKNTNNYDIAVSVKNKKDNFYYSNNFISFQNVFITRVKDNIAINSINDIKDLKIVSFKGANKISGKEYNKIFNSNNKNYEENIATSILVRDFLQKKYDILYLDINIFKWFLKDLSDESLLNYKFDYIIDTNNTYNVVFKDENIKNIFNKNLAKIKISGKYQKIINSYLLHDKKAKIRIFNYLSKLLSQQIYENNTKEIKEIVNILKNKPYIKKLEVYSSNNELLYSSSNEIFQDSDEFDVFYFNNNINKKVGFFKINFNEILLSSYSLNNNLLASLNEFEALTSYSEIKKIYENSSYLSNTLRLTKKERLYIKNNPIVKYSETPWEPLIIEENGEFTGLVIDYLKIIEDKTSLKFELIKNRSWLDSIKSFEKKQLDILPSYSPFEIKIKDSKYSNIYESFNYIIVSKDNASFTNKLSDFKNRTLALSKDFSAYNLIKVNYPYIKIIETKTIKEAFELVNKNKAYATIEHSAFVGYYLKNKFPNLKVIGILEEKYNHSILLQKDNTILLSIINKALDSISFEEKRELRNKWIISSINTAVDYKIIYEILVVFILLLLIGLYILRKISNNKNAIVKINFKLNESINDLHLTKNKLEDSNSELQSTIENLKLAQDKLVDAEKMASLGGLVAGVAHEINTPVGIGLTGISHLEDYTIEINSKYNNELMSKEDFEEYLKTSKELSYLIHKNLKKAASLVSSFKQIAVDQSSEEKREFNFKDYLDEILQSIHSITNKTNISINIKCASGIKINSYPGAFSQIFTNLIMNSIIHGFEKYEKGNIDILVENSSSELLIIFKDNGYGIKKENLNKIFDPFFTTNRDNGGSGLGLNIIYNIINSRLKGNIKCYSDEGKGVKFVITIKSNN